MSTRGLIVTSIAILLLTMPIFIIKNYDMRVLLIPWLYSIIRMGTMDLEYNSIFMDILFFTLFLVGIIMTSVFDLMYGFILVGGTVIYLGVWVGVLSYQKFIGQYIDLFIKKK